MRYYVYDIRWDTDGEAVENLPKTMVVDVDDEEEIADTVSDKTGFCHFGFSYMKKYEVRFFEDDAECIFRCFADAAEHAKEQAENAYEGIVVNIENVKQI